MCDATILRGVDITSLSLSERRRLTHEAVFADSSEQKHLTDEFRLLPARLFSAAMVTEVLTFHVPNHPGVCHGFAFVNDDFNPHYAGTEDGLFVVRKTRYPDVYELYEDGVHPIPGNNIAYIPTLCLSKRLREIFRERNSTSMKCVYNTQRQKWVPCPDSQSEKSTS